MNSFPTAQALLQCNGHPNGSAVLGSARDATGGHAKPEHSTDPEVNRHPQPLVITIDWLKYSEQHMTQSSGRFGFVEFAETWNGRLAMLGFVIGLGTELLTGQGVLSQIGLG